MARLHISVAHLGEPRWPRFAVRDSKGRYWTSKGWSERLQNALLYHREKEAADEATAMNDCIEPRRFVVTVRVLVDHDEPFALEQVQDLLERSTVSLILPEDHDLEDADVEVNVDWKSLEEIL
jgi:hypothetical protein